MSPLDHLPPGAPPDLPAEPQALAADPRINAFVMANAGSGKTTTLVSRVARLLLDGAAPAAILCLTFTKAAAAEMQRRLYQRLGGWAVAADADLRRVLAELEGRAPEAYDERRLSTARTLFARALETPGGLKIQTIHAFCEQLLRRFPIEAGVSPRFRVVDEAEAASIAAAAREAVARAALSGHPRPLAEAYAALSGALAHQAFEAMFTEFEARRAELAAYVDRCGGLGGLPDAVARSLGFARFEDADPAAHQRRAVDEALAHAGGWAGLAEVLSASGKTDTERARKIRLFLQAAEAGDAAAAYAHLCAVLLTSSGKPHSWCEKSAAARKSGLDGWLLDRQRDFCGRLESVRAARIARDTVHALTLAGAYAEAYSAAKQATGALDFADLIERARHLLTDGPGAAWVLYKLDGGVDHLLIDEAQDTSPEQWDIVGALTAEFFAGAGAREDGRRRTVFVVGDEKQSIYSFQGAAPERLLAEARRYADLAGAVGQPIFEVPLVRSWRSAPEVLRLVDAVFADAGLAAALSPGRDRDGGPIDPEIRHEAGRADGLPGTVDLWEPIQEAPGDERRAWDEPVDAARRQGARRRIAERVVAEIRAIVEGGEAVHDPRVAGDGAPLRPADWGDVLVLVRKRGPMFEEVLRALKRAGVPVAGADRLRLAEHPVFEDLLALGRAALFPEDDLTLAAVLRGPLCDVDEQGLFDLAHARKIPLWGVLRDRAGERPEWEAARALVTWFRREARARTPFDLYAALLNRRDASGLSQRQRVLARLGPEAADALDAFLDQARAAEARGVTDLERFCAALAEIDPTVKREMDEPRGEVRVMTAHAAKGLEAPIVILPDAIFEDADGGPLLRTADGGFLWCGAKDRDCEASEAARAARDQREREESLRLLYVGLTRARDRLIVTGRVPARRKLENITAWWAPVAAAFDRLGPVRDVESASGPARRYGADPIRLPRAVAAPAATADTPAWLFAPAGREAGLRWASPSRLVGDDRGPAPSPLAAAGGLGRYRRGELIHRLLERLPELPPDRRRDAAVRLLAREPDLDEAQRAEMIEAAFGVLDDPRFAEVFGPGSLAEAAVAGGAPDLPPDLRVSGRLDRLVVTPERVLVVDYKTNRPAPDRAEDADPAYLAQMAAYVAVLRALYPDRPVEAALVWTDGPRLTPLSRDLVEATLARMRGDRTAP